MHNTGTRQNTKPRKPWYRSIESYIDIVGVTGSNPVMSIFQNLHWLRVLLYLTVVGTNRRSSRSREGINNIYLQPRSCKKRPSTVGTNRIRPGRAKESTIFICNPDRVKTPINRRDECDSSWSREGINNIYLQPRSHQYNRRDDRGLGLAGCGGGCLSLLATRTNAIRPYATQTTWTTQTTPSSTHQNTSHPATRMFHC
jgi:hypothetical protein